MALVQCEKCWMKSIPSCEIEPSSQHDTVSERTVKYTPMFFVLLYPILSLSLSRTHTQSIVIIIMSSKFTEGHVQIRTLIHIGTITCIPTTGHWYGRPLIFFVSYSLSLLLCFTLSHAHTIIVALSFGADGEAVAVCISNNQNHNES